MQRTNTVITHETVAAMLRNTKFLAEIPCLKIPSKQLNNLRPGCTQCSRDESAKKQRDIIKSTFDCLQELSPEGQNKLRKLLNTKAYSFAVTNRTGKTVMLHFRST
jgi:hypothetical protein